MKNVRLAIVGAGIVGAFHVKNLLAGKVDRCELSAICDNDDTRRRAFDTTPGVKQFHDFNELLKSDSVDAVLIATPHYQHTSQGISALEAGLHVLVEKPISVHKADCERLIAAHRNQEQVFATMFQQRTMPVYRKLRDLLAGEELGQLTRINWTCTGWFRSDAYYASSAWRATWHGEGGGVLLNQCPHQIDLMTWMFGMPSRVRGFCGFGKYHNISVEDEVTAYMEYPNGATGVFIANTSEAPGANRLEVCGDMGRIVIEKGHLHWTRNEQPMLEFLHTTDKISGKPATWEIDIPLAGNRGGHVTIIQNFVDAILDGAELIAPAQEGIKSVELANAMIYSSLMEKPVDLPLDGAEYERLLESLIRREKGAGKSSTGNDRHV